MNPILLACDPWLEHLQRHLGVSADGQDPEGVHQVRVAAARLRVWLRLGGRRLLEDDLRWLRNGAGPVRDLDVLLLRGGPAGYEQHLREEWARAHSSWVSALRSHRAQGLLQALPLLHGIDLERAFAGTRRWAA
ncbi:MAG: CHAD domain-containing protein, partial [Planctomycetota bacterium]|nr:CHAD domain-containing protein [Planctomycetota bacterium]